MWTKDTAHPASATMLVPGSTDALLGREIDRGPDPATVAQVDGVRR